MINQIITGDAEELSAKIPDESVQLIFTDPVYERLEDYTWLALEAQRILKPGGTLIVWCSTIKQFIVKEILDATLTFCFPMYYTVQAKGYKLHLYKVYMWTTPLLVYCKQTYTAYKSFPNTVISTTRPDSGYMWNKNLEPIRTWLPCFAHKGDIVWDPFTGYGSVPVVCVETGRRFIASEIDPEVAEVARNRIETSVSWIF